MHTCSPDVSQARPPLRDSQSPARPPPTPPMMPPTGMMAASSGAYTSGPRSNTRCGAQQRQAWSTKRTSSVYPTHRDYACLHVTDLVEGGLPGDKRPAADVIHGARPGHSLQPITSVHVAGMWRARTCCKLSASMETVQGTWKPGDVSSILIIGQVCIRSGACSDAGTAAAAAAAGTMELLPEPPPPPPPLPAGAPRLWPLCQALGREQCHPVLVPRVRTWHMGLQQPQAEQQSLSHLGEEDEDGRKREEAAGGPVTPAPGAARGSSSVSRARQAIASPGGPTHLEWERSGGQACCTPPAPWVVQQHARPSRHPESS